MTKEQYNERIDALNHAADRILIAFIFHSRKFLSDCPKAEDKYNDLCLERDRIVMERNRKFKPVKIDNESEVEQ